MRNGAKAAHQIRALCHASNPYELLCFHLWTRYEAKAIEDVTIRNMSMIARELHESARYPALGFGILSLCLRRCCRKRSRLVELKRREIGSVDRHLGEQEGEIDKDGDYEHVSDHL